MAKRFNITGTCFPNKHYMADVSAKFNVALNLVEQGDYFAINRPRQYGKTTMLYRLSDVLRASEEYIVLNISFEGIGDLIFNDEKSFSPGFVRVLARYANAYAPHLEEWIRAQSDKIDSLELLSDFITALVIKSEKKIILLIDEVDKSSNNQIFVSFLAMLRNKYLERETFPTFHSVVLAGLYDVKSLKLKLRPDEEAKYNSPWNIAADFNVVMELLPHEIVPMLKDYCQEQNVTMDTEGVAQALFYYSSGYPYLVSAMCKLIDEQLLPTKSERIWTEFDVETAADRLIRAERSTTNFDTLIKNLENDAELYQVVYRLVIENEWFNYNAHDPVIHKGLLHGIFKNEQGLTIHNRIYREIIANYMTSKTITSGQSLFLESMDGYLLANNALDMRKVLLKFQELMHLEHSKKDAAFIERNGRLLFLAFLKPIINGKGYTFKEPEISEERRMDIAVTFFQHKYIVELKMWRGDKAHKKGLTQLTDYLEKQAQTEGYMVIFEQNMEKSWKKGWIKTQGKKIFTVWV